MRLVTRSHYCRARTQIEVRGIRKLRHPVRTKAIRPYCGMPPRKSNEQELPVAERICNRRQETAHRYAIAKFLARCAAVLSWLTCLTAMSHSVYKDFTLGLSVRDQLYALAWSCKRGSIAAYQALLHLHSGIYELSKLRPRIFPVSIRAHCGSTTWPTAPSNVPLFATCWPVKIQLRCLSCLFIIQR